MTPEEHSLLERTYAMAEENNKILRSIRRSTRFSMAFRITYWVVIIFLSFGAFYFIQPYINAVTGAYSSISGNSGEQSTTDSKPSALESAMSNLFKQ